MDGLFFYIIIKYLVVIIFFCLLKDFHYCLINISKYY